MPSIAWAHTDLVQQIEQLTLEIEAEPANAALYVRRGNLHRLHRDWNRGLDDFTKARELTPGDIEIDLHEGRLRLDMRDFRSAEELLTAYVDAFPDNPTALKSRAEAYVALGEPLEAALDYGRIIARSDSPGPSVYSLRVKALLAAGEAHVTAARSVAHQGLLRFPAEVSLLGLATDMALAQADSPEAAGLLQSVPAPVRKLPQWAFRGALISCQQGRTEEARQVFTALVDSHANASRTRAGTWPIDSKRITLLAESPTPESCTVAAKLGLGIPTG